MNYAGVHIREMKAWGRETSKGEVDWDFGDRKNQVYDRKYFNRVSGVRVFTTNLN